MLLKLTFFCLLSLSVFSQKKKPIFDYNIIINKNKSIEEDKAYTLIVISSPFCGFCRVALKKLHTLKDNKNLNIIIYSFSGEANNNKFYQDTPYFDTFVFIDAEKDPNQYFDKLFLPRFYLYNKTDLVWKKKGYYKDIASKIERRIKRGI